MCEPFIFPEILIRSLFCQVLAYFSFQIIAHWAFGSFTHHHHNLSPITLLRISRSSNPSPPYFLGLQIFSQATKAHFFLSSPLPQRKSLCMVLNWCRTPFSAGRADSMKTGIDCRTALVSTNLPAKFNYLIVHFLILSCNLLITDSQMFLCKGLAVRGTQGRVSLWKPKILEIFLWIEMWVLKKKTLDLERLTSILEAMAKSLRICL